MNITHNNKDYDLKFGIKFIHKLDEKYSLDMQGTSYGIGLVLLQEQLRAYAPVMIVDTLVYSSNMSRQTASDYVESLNIEELGGLVDGFLLKLKETPLTALHLDKGEQRRLKAEAEANGD